jgi:hypothetical protein
LIDFIGQAKDRTFSLRAAIYEFQYPDVLDAFHTSSANGADVKIIYDAKDNAKGLKTSATLERSGSRSAHQVRGGRTWRPVGIRSSRPDHRLSSI